MLADCKSKYHARWQRLWQYSYVFGIGGTNPQHISHISSFLSLNNSLISWFQFPFLQRLHWWEYSQNLLSYLLLQIASQCSFVIGVAYKREGTMTEINVYRYISVKQREFAIDPKYPDILKIPSLLPYSSSKVGLPSAIPAQKVCIMSNRKRLYKFVGKKCIWDVIIIQNSRVLPCCNWCQETKFYVVRHCLMWIA